MVVDTKKKASSGKNVLANCADTFRTVCLRSALVSLSNASQVVLRQVGFNLSGNLSCEVTTDAPSFSTALVSKELMVIELPKRGPVLHTEKERYDVGDILRGNCTSAPSKPAAVMSAFINSIPVNKPESKSLPSGNGLAYTVLYLELRVEPAHMSNNGNLILRCTSVVATLYKHTAELSLGPRTSEPVPERVTSPSQSTRMLPCHLVVIILTPFLLR
ncbi:heterophilic cell-cell adhesion [Nesidiocoris tenuis]|uniref:Heterophilic cell-cell adhesion n=1 Tax=Nesidiocoris tenuis TaxID=355587 RepID=A0ABN7AHQ8_9HEMI|nr:heterophilic cell-cell adhesion [Nesidiocoris tenuis]